MQREGHGRAWAEADSHHERSFAIRVIRPSPHYGPRPLHCFRPARPAARPAAPRRTPARFCRTRRHLPRVRFSSLNPSLLTAQPSTDKAPNHQAGSAHLSTLRLFYLHYADPTASFALQLPQVAQSDYHAGLFTSSAKVTLHLRPPPPLADWICPVCAFNNIAPAHLCTLCGVPMPSQPPSLPCPACTLLNLPSRTTCEICSAPLYDILILKLSFRKGGDKPFYAALKRALHAKAWLAAPASAPGTGISGILHSVHASAKGQKDNLSDALQDLHALMAKAKDMVHLAADLNDKLTAAPAAAAPSEPEEATFIRSSLSQLGLQMPNAPVTLDMIKDERKWFEELARELAHVLQGIMKDRGIVALDEVWGGWNRARGIALIPPSTFLQVVPLLPLYTTPTIQMRTLASGLTVLHTPPYSPASFASRLAGFLSLVGPQTTMEIAIEENLPFSLVNELLQAVEADSYILRDDAAAALSGGGGVAGAQVRWWANLFEGYIWDGQSRL